MIIRTIAVQGFGCFADEFEIGPLSEGVNLLHAPNGSGKSTLVRAASMALVDGHRVRAAEMQAWRPWGRALAPKVTLEFLHGKHEYKVEKRFLEGAFCTLFRKEGGVWRSFMEGDEADDFLRREVLNCTPPGAGVAKPKNWGLTQVLWTTQGDLGLQDLSGTVVEAIQRSVGVALTSAGSKIESKVEELYKQFYTPGRGTLRTGRNGAPLNALQRTYDESRNELNLAEEELRSFEQMSAQVCELRGTVDKLRIDRAVLAKEMSDTAALVERYRTLQNERAQHAVRKRGSEAVYADLKERIEAIQRTRTNIADTEAKIAVLKQNLQQAELNIQSQTVQLQAAQAALESARLAENDARDGAKVVSIAAEHASARQNAEELAAKLGKIAEWDGQIAKISVELHGIKAPSQAEMRRLRQAIDSEADALRRLELARVTVEFEPTVEVSIVVIEGEAPGEVCLTPGTLQKLHGNPNLSFEVPNFSRMRVNGPTSNYGEVRKSLEGARVELTEFDLAFGSHDAEAMEGLRNQLAELETQKAAIQATRAGLLGGDAPEQVSAKLGTVLGRVAEIENDYPAWRELAPDIEALKSDTSRKLQTAVETRSAAEREWSRIQSDLTGMENARSAAAAELKTLENALPEAKRELDIRQNDGRTDEARKQALDMAALESDAARVLLEQVEEKLRPFTTDPEERRQFLETQSAQADQRLASTEADLLRAETRISDETERSPYDRVATLSEQVAVAGAQLERERRRMEAIQLLQSVMASAKSELLESASKPVEEAATALLSEICGTPLANIRLDSSFVTQAVVPSALAGSGEDVAIDRLSGGEREQVCFCTRLALADELARDERQLVVLDDVLTFTDDARLARICDVLKRKAERLQILILTCHPERFLAIRDARLFDLQALLARPAGVAGNR